MSNMSSNPLGIYKILVIGAKAVGKTTAIHRFVDKQFLSQTSPTIGVDFSLKSVQLLPSIPLSLPASVILQLWDIASEVKYRMILPYYVVGTQGILLVCDTTNPLTLTQLNEYLDFLTGYLDLVQFPIVLISTKHDLPSKLKAADVNAFMQQHMIREYLPTSAVTGLNIDAAFQFLGQLIAKQATS